MVPNASYSLEAERAQEYPNWLAYVSDTTGAMRQGSAMYYILGLTDFNLRGMEQLMNYSVL